MQAQFDAVVLQIKRDVEYRITNGRFCVYVHLAHSHWATYNYRFRLHTNIIWSKDVENVAQLPKNYVYREPSNLIKREYCFERFLRYSPVFPKGIDQCIFNYYYAR